MINTIIFDIGKVLVGYDFPEFFRDIFEGDEERIARVKDVVFENGIWDELDRGVWTNDEVLQAFIDTDPEIEEDIRHFWGQVKNVLYQYDFTKDWLEDLKARGYRLLFLSNWSKYLREQNPEVLDFIPLMDGGIFSCDVHLIKPDHLIYEAIIDEYELEPSKCIFLDDREDNIRAARECGLNGIVVTDHEEAAAQLEEWISSDNQFSRTQMLVGADAMDKLKKSRVAVFGIGGVGGYVCEALVRSGVGAFELIDSDRVSLTNLNRQIIALRSTIGQYKTEVMKARMLDINPDVDVTIHNCFFLPENADQFPFEQYDYVVDAVDTVAAKIELIMRAKAANVPVISAMGAGNKLDASRFKVADIYKTEVCPLARVMRREMKKRGVKDLKVVYSDEPPVEAVENTSEDTTRRSLPGSTAFAPSVSGLIIAGEIIKDLIK